MADWIVLAILALCALPNALTDAPRKCSQSCQRAPSHDFKFNVQPGHTYVYNFEANTETSVPGAAATGEDEKVGAKKPGGQRLHVTGQAEFYAGADCAHTMRLLNVQVTGADGKTFQDYTSCEKHPVGFTFNNGLLGDEICAEADDNPSNLNVKRAILSLVQVAKIQHSGSATFHETDIFGTCPTDFTYHEEGDVLKVTKRRNLNRCAHREGLRNTFLSSSYDGPSDFQSTPLLQSSLQVEQTLKNHIVVSAVGQEHYLFRPFSNGASGAQTTVTTKLTLVQHQPGPAPPVADGHASSIIYDSHNWNYGGANPEEQASTALVIEMLKNAEKAATGGVGMESAALFRRVVKVMRYASTDCLMEAYTQVKSGAGFSNKKTAKAIFLDALLQVGTGQSIEVVVKLINSKDISPSVTKLYFLGFSFVRHATRGALKAVSTLLESPSVAPEALLGAGALVGRYCSEHQCDDSISEYKILVGKLAHKLGKGCKPVSREHENEIVGALKGLMNSHRLTEEAVEAVLTCAVNNDVPTRIRVAALDTFHGDSCQPKLQKAAIDMMKNREMDSELRIKAYLAVTECPSQQVATEVKEMMETEPINQVGSFVSSHLLSLRTSSNPDHANAKHYLAGIRPKKRYPHDLRKFSNAFEMSYAFDGLNLGSSAEGNVIFSQKSFVPRSAMLNLTTDVFGHSFNLLEVGVRAENVDHVLESLLGPRGYFKTHSSNEVYTEGRETMNSLARHFKERLRKTQGEKEGKHGKRDVTREMVEAFGTKVGHSVDHDDHSLDLDFHMKLFGSEVSWLNYHGNLQDLKPDFLVDKFFDGLDEGINKAKDFKLHFNPSVAFLDTELVYPTGAGFELRLGATAHSAVDLKVETEVDFPSMFKDPGNAKFHVKLLPSASVEVRGDMVVNAFSSVMAGLEVVGTLHSSTGLDVEAHILENGHGIDVKLGLPKPKQEIFNVRTMVRSKTRERGSPPVVTPLKFDRTMKDYHGCFDQLAPATGLVVCGDVGFPWDGFSSVVVPKSNHAMFPLDGPFKASFHLEKDDASLTHYHFRALYSDKGPHKKSFEMLFETPKSTPSRTLQVLLEGDCETDKVVKVSVKTPWKKFAVEAALLNNDKEQSLRGKYMSDGAEYLAKIGLIVKSASGNTKVYTPVMELTFPEKKGKSPKGPKGKKTTPKGVSIEGTITVERDVGAHKHVYTFDGVNFVTPKGKFGLQGKIGQDEEHIYSTDMKFKYDDLKQYLAFKGMIHEGLSSGNINDFSIVTETEFTASQFPDFGFFAKWDYQRKPDHMENTFDLIHGPDLKSDVAHLHVSNLILYKYESVDAFEVSTKNSMTYPLIGMEGKLEGSVGRTNVHYDVEFKYDKHKVESELEFKFGKTFQDGYEFKWEVEAFGSGFELDSMREVTSPKTSKVNVCLELKPGGRKYEISSDLIHSYVGSKEFEFGANTVLMVPGHENYRIDGGIAVNPATFKSHLEIHVGQVCHLAVNAHGDLASDGHCKSAEWKAMIKNHLEGSGTYTSMDDKGDKGTFVVDLLKAGRKLKGEFSMVHPGDGTCKTVFDFFWNADKDPSKKLHFESLNMMPKADTLIDSKNKLVLEDKTTHLDVKITKDGPLTSGSMHGVVDIILHTGRHISFNGQHKVHFRPSSSGDSNFEFSNKYCDKLPSGTESCLAIEGGMNHLNIEHGTYDFNNKLSYVQHDGKDLTIEVNGKSVPKGEKREFVGKGFVGGAIAGPHSFSAEWGGEEGQGAYTFHALGKVGEDQSLGFKSSLDTTLDGGKTRVGEFHLEGHTKVSGLHYFAVGQKAKMTVESPQIFDFSSSTEFKLDKDQTLTIGAKVNRHGEKGSGLASVRLPGQAEDHVVSAEWSHDPGTPRVEGALAFMWPQGKQVRLELQATTPKDSMALHLVAHTPVQGHEKMELLINHRNIWAEHALETDVTVIASPEHKTTVHSRIEFAHTRRTFDLTVSRQGGVTNKAFVRLEKKGDNQYESEVKLDWEGEHLLAETSARFDGIEDFNLHGLLDSSVLKVNKWSIDIATKQGGGAKGGSKGGHSGKKIVFTVHKADEVVLQGSTSFSRKQEGNTITYEGTGVVTMSGDTKNGKFHLSTTTLSSQDGEVDGVETKLSMEISSSKGDKHALMGEAKLTGKEVRFYNSYCKGDDECSHLEAYSKINFIDMDHDMDHEFAFILDLKHLINLTPVSIKGSTHTVGDYNLDHKVEVQLNKGESKYSYHLYVKEHEAGASLTLPKRTIALIGTLHGEGQGKKEGGLGGINAEVIFWLDKENHPELKTTGAMLVDVTESADIYTLMFEGKITHPSLGKPIAIRGKALVGGEHAWLDSKIDFDLFAKRDQMLVMCVKLDHEPVSGGGHNVTALLDLKSKGQNIDVEWVTHAAYTERAFGVGTFATYLNAKQERKDFGVLLRGSDASIYLLVKSPTCELLRVDTKLEFTKAKQVITQETSVFGTHTHIDQLEFKGLNSFKYQSYEKGSPNDQFLAHGTLVWGKAMEIYFDRLKGGQKEVMAHLHVGLDQEHFFDVKHIWEQEKIKTYLTEVKNDFTHLVDEAKKMSEEMRVEAQTDMKALLELLNKYAPNVKSLLASYQTQLNEIKEEILNDPVIGGAVSSVREAVAALTGALSQTIDKLTHMFEDLMEKWNVLWGKVIAFYEKMTQMLNESTSKIVAVFAQEFEKFGHYAVDAFERYLEFMQQFSGEFKAFGKVIVQFLQDVARTVAKLIDEVQHRYTELVEVAAEHFKAMPAYEYLKEMYAEFLIEFPQQVRIVIFEVLDTAAETAPTKELQDFLIAFKGYLLKKVDKVECDDKAELEALFKLFDKAMDSIFELVRSQGKEYQLDTFFQTPIKFPFWPLGTTSQPFTFSYGDIYRLPFFFATRFSPFFWRLDDFPRPSEVLEAYWPSLPRGLIPPYRAYGLLVGGEHFFTFDNRHYSLSGCACNYVLAQDFEDGNFSVVAHLENGELKSVTLMDAKETIVLNTDSTVKLNGAPTELPAHHGTISAWTEFDSISIKSDYGVRVTCDLRFKQLCLVIVNGYYFGKTRGLLGSVNNEPYDDFIMPNGKIASSVDKLANSWKVNPSCGPVSEQTHDHEHVSQCSDMFAGFSSMRLCFPIVNPAGYRQVCDANVAMGGGDPCEVAAAYVIACHQEGIEISLPNKCAQCSIGGSPVDAGFSVSLKAPQGKADVMLVVEQLPDNEAVFKDLVVPLVTYLSGDLKAYKINDVKFILVGFGGHNQKWPSIYTVNGQIGFDGKGDNVKFEVAEAEENKLLEDTPDVVKEYVRRFERLRKLVNVEFGNVNYGETFQLVREYPFRPGAARTVVAVLQSRCLYSPLPFSSQAVRLFFQKRQYQVAGVSLHMITPLEFSAPSKDKKMMKNVVGADKDSVFTLSDAKKKFIEGDSQLRKELKYDRDLCVDFAFDTNGAAFSSRNFVDISKPLFKKQFVQVVSQRIAQSLAPEFTEDCTCKLYNGLLPVTECRVTSRKEREHLKAATKTVKG